MRAASKYVPRRGYSTVSMQPIRACRIVADGGAPLKSYTSRAKQLSEGRSTPARVSSRIQPANSTPTRCLSTSPCCAEGSDVRDPTRQASARRGEGTDSKAKPGETASKATLGNAPAAQLPSEAVSNRHALSARLSQATDNLLVSLASTSQRVNEYTGTDYTGIAALRSEIRAHEDAVKDLLNRVGQAKLEQDAALAAQSASQKEVVQLLERKHSWGNGDLERYMALIRSEHEHDTAVRSARDALRALEQGLEDARGQLERKERRQYHEEQVWSDTIRRNSTWITFGLMGFNVVVLLASVVIIEPWRRRRLVRELKTEIDERLLPSSPSPSLVVADMAHNTITEIEQAISPSAASVEGTQELTEALAPSAEGDALLAYQPRSYLSWDGLRASIADLFSDRVVHVRRLDMTTVALEGVAVGTAVAGILFIILRPK